MTLVPPERDGLPHGVFLERLAGASATSPEGHVSHCAFLTLRLVDLLAPERESVRFDVFHYQQVATERLYRELPADSTETGHIVGLGRGAADAFHARDVQLVTPALLAYAHYLEDEARLPEALDVLETLARVGGERLPPADVIATRLRMARVLRKLNQFDRADELYAAAGTLAAAAEDGHAEFLSRIGRAYATIGRGNLAEADRQLQGILVDAKAKGDRFIQAQAEQGIGVVRSTGGQPAEAIGHIWRAFRLYEDEPARARTLGDLGIMLLTVGAVDGAERALHAVVAGRATQDVVNNALIELMHCASYRRDRVGFERWKARCEAERTGMSPNMLVDFSLKAGIGLARFGQFERAETMLGAALEMAETARLHEFVFRIERIQHGLRDCQRLHCEASETAAEPVCQSAEVREVSASLAHLSD